MRSTPVVVGVTPCCGNIHRTSSAAIQRASHEMDGGRCPDCELDLTESISVHRDIHTKMARRWFMENARVIGNRWQWNANAAFVAFVEIYNCE